MNIMKLVHAKFAMFSQQESLKRKININTGKVKPNYFKRQLTEAKETLQYQHKSDEFKRLLKRAVLLGTLGFFLGLVLQNFLLSPILAAGLALIPIWRVKLSRHKYDLFVADELESGLSVITTAYIRKNNLIASVQDNIAYLNHPLKDVMDLFLKLCSSTTPSVVYAVKVIQPLISNDIWDEWCREVIKCQANSTLRSNLVRIVRKLSDIKTIQSDIDLEMDKCTREFLSILGLAFAALPLIYFINPAWFALYFTHPFGKAVLVFVVLVVVLSLAKLISLLKPVRYRR